MESADRVFKVRDDVHLKVEPNEGPSAVGENHDIKRPYWHFPSF